jgi:hypothetical protein
MSKFVFVYHAPVQPADAPQPSPEEMEKVMGAWMAWAGKVGDGMVDFGTPLAGGIRVSKDGSTTPSDKNVVGYTILEAADLDAALELAKDHPHLQWADGCEIEIHEGQPVPGM